MMARIAVTHDISIDEAELDYCYARAAGPGGQNVNKVETAVHLRFDVAHSPSLDFPVKRRLERLAGTRLTKDGVIVILAQAHRTQEQNRKAALEKLLHLIEAAAREPKPRVKTRPTLASKKRRLDAKARRGETKRLRSGPAQ